jgi:hypothetical protein
LWGIKNSESPAKTGEGKISSHRPLEPRLAGTALDVRGTSDEMVPEFYSSAFLLAAMLWSNATAAEPQPIVFRDVTVIDATGAAPKPHMTVVLSGNRISEIATGGDARVPENARILDAPGKFLIPGMWDRQVSPLSSTSRLTREYGLGQIRGRLTHVADPR